MTNNMPENVYSHESQEPAAPLTPDEGTYVRRTHKDKLFRYIFRDKRKLLQLYNAINHTSYEDVDGLTINTLENVIYLGYKNDISFLLDSFLCLMEHQSSWNPNITLRGFLYFARLYRGYLESANISPYGTSRLMLPFPQFVVFYNGTNERPEREVLCLSDSFLKSENKTGILSQPALECKALVLNINYGKNRELMEKCRPLLEYSLFIHYIRENISKGHNAAQAVNLAVERCLGECILTDVLKSHRQEVVSMFLDEYDDELFTRRMYENLAKDARETGWKEGWLDGQQKGRLEGQREGQREGRLEGARDFQTSIQLLAQKLIADHRQEELLRSLTDSALQKTLLEEYGLSIPVLSQDTNAPSE